MAHFLVTLTAGVDISHREYIVWYSTQYGCLKAAGFVIYIPVCKDDSYFIILTLT